MTKLIVMDMDGVLLDCKEMHYESLNRAIVYHGFKPINREEHLSTYDGLSTRKKLEMLTERKGLPKEYHLPIYEKKQKETIRLIDSFVPDYGMIYILHQLKKEGFKLCVASNSIKETVEKILKRKGFYDFFDFFLSNEDVIHPKPNTEIYLKAMLKAQVSPKETLIIEDSHIGRKGAAESGALVCPVRDSSEVTFERIMRYATQDKAKVKWDAGELNILIPMAGAGSRFADAGYTFPKPLIEVRGEPMIKVVVDNLNLKGNYIFIVQKEHYDKYNLKTMLNLIVPGCTVIVINSLTEGAACTTLFAKEFINNNTPLLIANSDQYLDWESSEFMYSMQDGIDGGILTFQNCHPKWSYAKIDEEGFVSKVAEKDPISTNATCGVYFWNKGSDYIKYTEQMISKNIRTNGEFYVAPTFNEAIEDGKKIKAFEIKKFSGIGTPEDLKTFLDKYED